MCKKLFARLTKSKDPSSSRYRRDMARQICGHHVRYITEKRNDIEEVIGREGSLNIKDDCFIVSTPADTILRCRTEDMQDKDESRPLVAGGICVDERAHTVFVNEQEVQLTLKEYQLLCLLMKNRGAVLTRDVLLENIWGYNNESETRTVDVHIRTLRQKLGADGALIETVRGVGYRMGEHT